MNDAYKQALGTVFKAKRKAQHVSQEKLALMVGLSKATVRNIEKGEANPRLDTRLRLSQGLDVPFADITAECESRIASSVQLDYNESPWRWQRKPPTSRVNYLSLSLPKHPDDEEQRGRVSPECSSAE